MQDGLHSLVAPYALDALGDEEERGFEEHLATCERCREELAGLREAAASLAYGAAGPAPPSALKERILEQARAERPNVRSLPRRSRRWAAPVAAAAALAAAVALGVGVWSATRPETSDPFASVLAQPGAKLVPVDGRGAVAVAPDGSAALALTVPPAPKGKDYEAWVIDGGKATRAGLFGGSEGTSVLNLDEPVRRGAVVAVTLERDGGVEQPTQEPLAASGAVS
jgi:anti-sigma-K factor RskA